MIAARGLLRRITALNAASLGGAKVAADLINVVLLVLLARMLGASDFGVYGLGMALGGMASLAVAYGWRNLVIRDVAAGRQDEHALLGSALAAQGLALLAIALVSPLLLWLPDPGRQVAAALYAMVLYQCLLRVLMLLRAWFTAHEESRLGAGVEVLEKVLALVFGVSLLLATGSIWPTLAAFPLAAAIACAVAFTAAVRRYGAPRFSGAAPRIAGNLKAAAPFFLVLLAATLMDRAGVLVLGWYHDTTIVGIYSAAERLVAAGTGAVLLSAAAFQPVFARLWDQARGEAQRLLRQALGLVVLLLAPVSALGVVLAEPVVGWLFGEDYFSSIGPLRVLAVMLLPAGLYAVLAQWLLATGGQRALLGAQVAALAVYLVMLAVLVPGGAQTGLAWARLLGSCVLVISVWLAVRTLRTRGRIGADEKP